MLSRDHEQQKGYSYTQKNIASYPDHFQEKKSGQHCWHMNTSIYNSRMNIGDVLAHMIFTVT